MCKKFITEVLVKGALLHQWLNLLFTGLDGTYFKNKQLKAFSSNENLATHINEFSILEI